MPYMNVYIMSVDILTFTALILVSIFCDIDHDAFAAPSPGSNFNSALPQATVTKDSRLHNLIDVHNFVYSVAYHITGRYGADFLWVYSCTV